VAAPISPRCHICQREWRNFAPLSNEMKFKKLPGLKLRVTGRLKGTKYRKLAEVVCFDCGHVWWSKHRQLIQWAEKVDANLPLLL